MPSEDKSDVSQLPSEIMFTITKPATQGNAARLGFLKLPNRKPIQTPHYLALGSRGVIPHLTQDNVVKHTDIRGVYMAVEDSDRIAHTKESKVVEKPSPQPILKFNPPDGASRLRRFTATPDDHVLVLGARRTPPVPSPGASTDSALSIMTSLGFRKLPAQEFRDITTALQPDIIVGLGDIPYGYYKVSHKKIDKITDRTAKWMQDHVGERAGEKEAQGVPKPLMYAPLLPLPIEAQKYYVDSLMDDLLPSIHGLAIYHTSTLQDLPSELSTLPRLGLTEAKNPRAILQDISRGIDLATVPFLGAITDAGIAFSFSFPAPKKSELEQLHPLGEDMWDSKNATDVSPIRKDCPCYACTTHHRAFIQHLLCTKEMLAWVLIQMHNHHIIDEFFAGIRESLARGTFEQDVADFERVYEAELPEQKGQGPRLRGYQFKSDGPNERKRNPVTFKVLKPGVKKNVDEAKSVSLPDPDSVAEDLERVGFAEKVD